MARKAAPTGDIVKLKVTLQGISPPIWRRLLIPAAMTLRDLHEILQTSMGWHDSHLHDFDVAGDRFGDPATTDEVENEARMTLDRVRKAGIARFKYNYDFGDDWEHLIVIEGAVPRKTAAVTGATNICSRSWPTRRIPSTRTCPSG